jgi:ATP-binding cassette subfamily B (MDR/TAP) protein 1
MAKDDGPAETVEEKAAAPVLRSFASVFVHADAADVALMVLGLVGAMGDGMSTPVMLAITSRVFDDTGSGPDHLQQFRSKMNEVQIPSLTTSNLRQQR